MTLLNFFSQIFIVFTIFSKSFSNNDESSIQLRVLGIRVLRENSSTAENSYENFRHQAALECNGIQICGAAVITDRIVITAAHCTWDCQTSNLTIRVGSLKRNRDGQTVQIHSILNHPFYNNQSDTYDISIMLLNEKLNRNIFKPALLPNQPLKFNGEILTISGWGGHLSRPQDHLQYTKMKVLNKSECESANKNYELQICTRQVIQDTGHCYRDSGGPLVKYEKFKYIGSNGTREVLNRIILIGIAVGYHGRRYACTDKNTVYFYTNVYAFREWIGNVITNWKKLYRM